MIIREPVHGDIAVSDQLRLLLDTPEMQRLRGIKQTGTAHLVYPGCIHTRFEHSLGTLAMASRILDQLAAGGNRAAVEPHRTVVQAAALVHDITHLPYGHTCEDERFIFARHDRPERFTAALAADTGIGDALARLGLREAVLATLAGQPQSVGLPPWTAQVVSGAVDADLLDYLKRDAYHSGIRQTYDDRVLSYFALDGGELVLALCRHGLDRSDARSEILHLLRLRYFLTERLYLHHTKLAAGAMVARAVESACARGLTEATVAHHTDEALLSLLEQDGGADTAWLIGNLRRRRLVKRAYAVRHASDVPEALLSCADPGARRANEQALADKLGLPAHQVMLYCPRRSSFKEAAMPVLTAAGRMLLDDPQSPAAAEITTLKQQYEALWTFYVFVPEEHRRRAGAVCADHFGRANDYRPAGGGE
ncbi:MAG: HD domain-containing protein [Chloroflexota bacterium]